MTAALLFDLDGTLVDSDADHLAAFQEVFAPFGVTLDRARYTAEIMGASNTMIGARFLPHLSPPGRDAVLDAKEAAYRARVGVLTPTHGVLALLDYAQARGLPWAVVTNAPRASAEIVLAALGLADRLETLVIGPELAHAKPHPLPYLTALARLGARAERAGVRGFAVGRARGGRGGDCGRGDHDRSAGEDAHRGGRGVRGERFHRSAHLRGDRGAHLNVIGAKSAV